MATSYADFVKRNPQYVGQAYNPTSSAPPPPSKPKGRGGFFSSLISELSGAGGAWGGGAAGAAAGTALFPGVGTLVGGILGATAGGFAGGAGGRAVENKVRDDQNFLGAGGSAKSAFGEGALSGALAGIGSGASAYRGLKAVGGLKGLQAATGGADELANASKAILTGGKKAGINIANGGLDDLTTAAKLTAGRNSAERVGNSMYRSTLGVDDIVMPGNTKPTTLFKADELTEAARKIGLKGSPAEMQRQAGVAYDRFNTQVSRKLAESKGTLPFATFNKQALADVTKELPIKVESTLVKDELQRTLTNNLKTLAKDGKLDATAINQFKNSLPVDSAFKKIAIGGNLTAKETVDLALWKKADEWIAGNTAKGIKGLAPAAKELTSQQSKLYGLAQGLGRMTRTPGDPHSVVDLAARIASPTIRKGQNAIGRGLMNAGAMEAGIPGKGLAATLAKGTAYRGVANHMFMPGEAPITQQDNSQYTEGGQDQADFTYNPDPNNPIPNSSSDLSDFQPEQSMYGEANLMADIQRDPKHQADYISLFKTISALDAAKAKKTGLNVGKVSSQNYSNAQSGYSALQALSDLYQSDPGVITRSGTPGRTLPLVGGYIANKSGTTRMDALAANVADKYIRLTTGATANADEIKNMKTQMLPRPGDTPQQAQYKLRQFASLFQSILGQAQGQDSGGLDDALMQLQNQGAY